MLRKTTHMMAVSGIAVAIFALAFTGVRLSTGIAQIGSDAPGDLSGTINSVLQDTDGTKHVIGGEWTLLLDGDKVKDFSADLVMVGADGTGSHTHKIVLSEGQTETASAGEVTVTLLPTEQSAGKTVLVNATGLAEKSNVNVTVGNMVAGTPQSDDEGNLLFALGIPENMTGSVTVSVEDQNGNSGSAAITIGEAKEATGNNQTLPTSGSAIGGNLTGNEGNATAPQSGNTTLSGNSNMTSNQSSTSSNYAINNTVAIQGYTPPSGSTTENSNLTTFEGTIAAENTTDIGNSTITANATSTSSMIDNATSTLNESTIKAETNGNTTTFKAVGDIYTGDELKWKNVDITVSIINGTVITIEIDPGATDNHFGLEPIYGLVKTGPE